MFSVIVQATFQEGLNFVPPVPVPCMTTNGSKTCKPQIEAGSSGMICHCDVDKRWDWYGRVLWSSTLMRPLHSDFSVSRFVTQGASTQLGIRRVMLGTSVAVYTNNLFHFHFSVCVSFDLMVFSCPVRIISRLTSSQHVPNHFFIVDYFLSYFT